MTCIKACYDVPADIGCCLAHTSLAMTPEQSVISREKLLPKICKNQESQGACASHSRRPSVTEPAYMPVAKQSQMAALFKWQRKRSHATLDDPLQYCSAHGSFIVIWADLICGMGERMAVYTSASWTSAISEQSPMLDMSSVSKVGLP